MNNTVLDMFCKNSIAFIAFPAHASDRLQQLDVLVSGPLNHFAIEVLLKITAEQVGLHCNQVYMT